MAWFVFSLARQLCGSMPPLLHPTCQHHRTASASQPPSGTFSRLDFLRDADGTLHFLEFNPNGQYAWLDLHNERGMFTAIAEEILQVHNRNIK